MTIDPARPRRRRPRAARPAELQPDRLRPPPPDVRLGGRRSGLASRPDRARDRADLGPRSDDRQPPRRHGRAGAARRARSGAARADPPRARGLVGQPRGRDLRRRSRLAGRRPPRPPTRSSTRESRLDILVDNAGAIVPERRLSPDGFELSLATMVLGPFVLTSRLLPLLRAGAAADRPARIVAVTSGGMYAQRLHLDDLELRAGRVQRPARLRPRQAGPGRAHARVGAPAPRARGSWPMRCTRAGRTPGPGGVAARVPRVPRAVRADTPRKASTRSSGWPPPRRPAARPAGCSSTAGPDRSTAIPTTRVAAAERRALWDRVVALTGETPELD